MRCKLKINISVDSYKDFPLFNLSSCFDKILSSGGIFHGFVFKEKFKGKKNKEVQQDRGKCHQID